jgi:hypothetical protein
MKGDFIMENNNNVIERPVTNNEPVAEQPAVKKGNFFTRTWAKATKNPLVTTLTLVGGGVVLGLAVEFIKGMCWGAKGENEVETVVCDDAIEVDYTEEPME